MGDEAARVLEADLLPATLDQCSAPEPDFDDGLTTDEKFLAFSRLEADGRTRSSEKEQTHTLSSAERPSITLRYGWVCQAGFYPEDLNKKNQDNLLVAPDLGTKYPEMSLFGVFDGHGKHGTECSTFAVERFGKCILAHKQLKTSPETAIEDSLVRVNKDMHKAKKKRKNAVTFFDDTLAGTTAINVLFVDDEIIAANVGDSRAVIANDSSGALKAQPLSVDQTPYRRDERDRCRKAGAVVMTMDQLEGYRAYDPDVDEWGDEEDDGGDPPRLWLPNKGCPGVAFTRSLGDEMAEAIGCIPNPEIVRRRLVPSDKFLVIASDGVFEFLSSQTVVDMVAKFTDPYEAARALVTESYKLWLHYEVRTDDITAIVIFLEHPEVGKTVGISKLRDLKQSNTLTGSFKNLKELVNLEQESRPVRREMSRRKRQVIEASAQGDGEDEDDGQEGANQDRAPKTREQLDQIKNAISTNFLFQHLNPMQLGEVLNAFTLVEAKPGDKIINQGEAGDRFYVVGTGEYDCFIRQENGEEQKVHTYVAREGSVGNPSFGELALMYTKPRAASVVAKTEGVLWALNRRTFRRVLIKRPNKELIGALRKVKVLETLGKSQLQRLADTVSEVAFEEGDVIIRQGDVGDTMFIIKEGQVRVTIDEQFKRRQTQLKRDGLSMAEGDMPSFDPATANEVMRVEAGGYFGERALLQSEPRAANVLSVGKTTCFYISRKAFEDVLGPLSDIIGRHAKLREAEALAVIQMQEELRAAKLSPTLTVEDIAPNYVVNATDTLTIRVVHARGERDKTFSLKSFHRDAIEVGKNESRVQRDRQLLPLAAVRNKEEDRHKLQFVFPILKTFIGKDNLHMALGGVTCGPLHDFMSAPFSEDVARFIAASIVLMLETMHAKGIMLRAINPQTLMLDSTGMLRIADMGTSKFLEDTSARSFTLCGDPCYMAPEQVLNHGHSSAVDYWALGILLYEMLEGKVPFSSDDPFSEVAQFDASKIEFSPTVSGAAKDLFRSLARPSPAERLTNTQSIMEHSFFAGFDWQALSQAEMLSPLAEAARDAMNEMVSAPTPREDVIDQGTFTGVIPSDSWFHEF